jgi:hypothetical protein
MMEITVEWQYQIIYRGISTLEITGIFITLTVNYYGILTLEKVGFFTVVIYLGPILSNY